MSKATLTSKGQLTIPVEIRRALGLDKGDAVVIELVPEGALMRKVEGAGALRGTVPARKLPWKSVRRKAWRARAERLASSSVTRTSSSGS